jgi:hypothetical protein
MMGLIDHPLTPLIVAWLEAVYKSAAYGTIKNWQAKEAAREALNAALEELK